MLKKCLHLDPKLYQNLHRCTNDTYNGRPQALKFINNACMGLSVVQMTLTFGPKMYKLGLHWAVKPTNVPTLGPTVYIPIIRTSGLFVFPGKVSATSSPICVQPDYGYHYDFFFGRKTPCPTFAKVPSRRHCSPYGVRCHVL